MPDNTDCKHPRERWDGTRWVCADCGAITFAVAPQLKLNRAALVSDRALVHDGSCYCDDCIGLTPRQRMSRREFES